MNKKGLITLMSEKSGLTQKNTEIALKAFMESVEETLEKGEKIQLVKFGTFETRQRKERNGRNPKTNEDIVIPASTAPVFKFAKNVKEKVNK